MYQPTIFRTYDIRGLVDKEFDGAFVGDLARAFATYLEKQGQSTCCVGRDGRHTSPEYHRIFIQSLVRSGVSVFDLGMVSTPLGYFSCFQDLSPNCVVITASHNPKEYNGFKLVVQKQALRSELIQELRTIVQQQESHSFAQTGHGTVTAVDIESMYLDFLKKQFQFQKPHRFLVDCGNGMTGLLARRVFDLFGFETRILFEEVDGNFPNHIADPTQVENLQELIAELKKPNHGYEFGIGYDGDGDRIGVVTPKGRLLYGDLILLLLTQEMVKKYQNPQIIADVKSSKVLYDGIENLGGRPVMFRTGHSLIKAKLNELSDAPLAGEMSGHIFYKDDFFGYDDALYVTLRLIQVLETMEDNMQMWVDGLPPIVNTPELHIPCSDDTKDSVVKELHEVFAQKYPEAKLIDVDGIRLEWDDRWALVRASNTTPVLVLRFEAANQESCQKLKEEVSDVVKKHVR